MRSTKILGIPGGETSARESSCPSGDQDESSFVVPSNVNWDSVSRAISYSQTCLPRSSLMSKATRLPSGERRGPKYQPLGTAKDSSAPSRLTHTSLLTAECTLPAI